MISGHKSKVILPTMEPKMTKATPKDRLFSEEHEWVRIEGDTAVMGISDHAQASLGDVVYVELPAVGKDISKGSAIGVVESVKAVSDIYAPVSGKVKSINADVLAHPEKINSAPYEDGWLLVIELSDLSEKASLLSPQQYEEMLAREAK